MKHSKRASGVIVAALVAGGVLSSMPAAQASDRGWHSHGSGEHCEQAQPCVVPVDQRFQGLTYGEWQARYNQWLAAIPTPDHPIFDDTGARCHVGQSGPVWFAAPVSHNGTTDRTCELPEGTALFVLVQQNECDSLSPPPFYGANEADLRTCAASGYETAFSTAVNTLRIDGQVVPNLDGFRTQSPLFSLTYPADNIGGSTAGTGISIADGEYVLVSNLSVGTHRIELHGDIASGPLAGTIDDDYTIIITADHHDCAHDHGEGHDHDNGHGHS